MKKALLTLAAVAAVSTAFAQGTTSGNITFYNLDITGPQGPYRAGIFRDNGDAIPNNGTVGAGAGFTVGLFKAGETTPLFTQLFRVNNNFDIFAQPVDVTVTGVAPGQTANLVVKAWSTSAGTFEAAQTIVGAQWGEQAFTSRGLGGPNPDPTQPAIFTPDMGPGFTGFEMTTTVPEPTTIALAAVGIGALLLRRRK